ncbi:unnamed protein product [Ostreobium quekettii]|uniref:Uncharacterized protein n=1 Tax=Ostreobium quekettii TaxID=121088 RepID=A0A8S1IRC9_9CHLO|nr:unnamed protein product [Ostreobium quekettii]
MAAYGPHLPSEEDAPERLPCRESGQLTGHEGAVLAVRFNRQGTYILSCGKDQTVRLWNPHRQLLIKTYTGHGYEVRDTAVLRDNSQFATVGGDREIFLWDVGSGRIIRRFRGHEKMANAVEFGPDDATLVTAGYDQCVKVWDCRARTYDALQTMKAFKDSVTCLQVTSAPDIIAGSVDGTVRRFDIRAGRMYTDDLHNPVTGIAVSGDEQCILASCMADRILLIDKSSGQLLETYRGHKHRAYKVECCFTPSDAAIVGASEDGQVLYWDLVDAKVIRRFTAHDGVICSIAMHPEGTSLVTSSTGGDIKVWT